MDKPAVVMVTAAGEATFRPEQLERLRAVARLRVVRRTEPVPPDALRDLVGGAEVAGLTPRTVPALGPEAVACLPDTLRGLAVFATGVDFIDLDALARRGITLSRLPDYSAVAVAEHTLGLMLTLSRRIHLSRDRVMGRVPPGTSVRGWELRGRTLGVVGAGRIGGRVARLAQALGMRVLACDPRRPALDGVAVRWVGLDDLLGQADVVSLHVPSHWQAPPLLGASRLRAMKRGACLVNTSRASLVDEAAVVAAVADGHLAGYAVDDCLRHREAAARLIAEGRIVETGHTAWYSDEALARGVEDWVENAIALAAGRPRNVVPLPACRGEVRAAFLLCFLDRMRHSVARLHNL